MSPPNRILGIDFGDRWFGLAITDPGGSMALPLDVLDGEPALFAALEELVPEKDIGLFLLGFPLNMDGSAGKKARQVMEFKARLEKRFDIPVELWDERLTTVEAERRLREAGVSERIVRSKVDQVAAQILLESYLNSPNSSPGAIDLSGDK